MGCAWRHRWVGWLLRWRALAGGCTITSEGVGLVPYHLLDCMCNCSTTYGCAQLQICVWMCSTVSSLLSQVFAGLDTQGRGSAKHAEFKQVKHVGFKQVKHMGVAVYGSGSAPMRWCGSVVVVWQCGSVAVWQCGNVAVVWQCGRPPPCRCYPRTQGSRSFFLEAFSARWILVPQGIVLKGVWLSPRPLPLCLTAGAPQRGKKRLDLKESARLWQMLDVDMDDQLSLAEAPGQDSPRGGGPFMVWGRGP